MAPERLLPRGRHDLPREFVARTQRDRLIDAMAQTVAAKGYVGTSLNDVCATAGVSTKAFYEHFTDKEACFLATFDRGVDLLQKSVVGAYQQPGRWPERMYRGLGMLLHILAGEPAFAALAVVEVMAAGSRALERRRLLLTGFTMFFSDAPRRASSPQVPPIVVEAVVAGIYGVIFDYVVAGKTAELPEHLPELAYFALAPFVGPRVAAATVDLPYPG
jgi:AcrR family transcriptional regulator